MVAVTDPRPTTKVSGRQVVYSFNEGTEATRTPAIRGGKGAYLADMTALGLPVPPGFTITTSVARAFREHGELPKRFHGQFDRALKSLERRTSLEFGNPERPLLVSVRSGAQASMPGMMDTVLNVGLSPATVQGMAEAHGARFAFDAYRRFLAQFSAVVLGVPQKHIEYALQGHDLTDAASLKQACERLRLATEFVLCLPFPDEPWDQLNMCVDAVMRSWQSERATVYRRANSLPEWWGTAVNVQQMVFGNRSDASGTGVVFSHDITTGHPGLCGEFLPNAQGEDVVSGTHTPLPIADMKRWDERSFEDLQALVGMLSVHLDDIVDVEFTVEDGQLFLLQARRAKRTTQAAVTYLVRKVWDGSLRREDAVAAIPASALAELQLATIDHSGATPLGYGLAASPGAAVGMVVTTSAEAIRRADQGEDVVLVTRDTTPDDLPGMLRAKAIVTLNGGFSCHAALVARELGLPAVVGVNYLELCQLQDREVLSVDGTHGTVYDGELALMKPEPTKELRSFLAWHDRFARYVPRIGFEWMSSLLNVNSWLNDFYLSDRMAADAAGTSLEHEACTLRTRIHQDAAEMLVCYLMIAVAGEIQYAFDRDYGGRANLDRLERLGVMPVMRNGHLASQESVAQTLSKLDVSAQIEYFRLATEVFDDPRWSGSIGGAKWARIAEAGYNFLSGDWSPATFVDHVFDLRHNGGRLFDKHAMVNRCTSDHAIPEQLETKKFAASTRELHANLYLFCVFSDHVEKFYQQGLQDGLW